MLPPVGFFEIRLRFGPLSCGEAEIFAVASLTGSGAATSHIGTGQRKISRYLFTTPAVAN
jgi:hypothetical protein